MGDFKKFNRSFDKSNDRKPFGSDRFGGGRKFGGDRDRDRDRGPRQMHSATCAECGKDCEVPFKPVGGKPVLCSNCFKGKESSGSRFASKSFGGGNDRSFGSRDRAPSVTPQVTKEMFDALNVKVDKVLSLLRIVEDAVKLVEKDAKKVVKKEKLKASTEKDTVKKAKKAKKK